MNINEDIWIGLLQVSSRSKNGLLGSSSGAYVNVLAKAKNSNDFIEKVKKSVNELDLDFVEINEIDLFNERQKKFKINNSIICIAKDVTKSKELRFGNFHTYE